MWVRWQNKKGEWTPYHHVSTTLVVRSTCGLSLPTVLQERTFDFNSQSKVCKNCERKVKPDRGN